MKYVIDTKDYYTMCKEVCDTLDLDFAQVVNIELDANQLTVTEVVTNRKGQRVKDEDGKVKTKSTEIVLRP